MIYNTLIYQKTEFVGNITLNRPADGNTIDAQLAAELADICVSIKADETIKIVTITGTGGKFCLGTSQSMLSSYREQELELPSVTNTILDIDRPVIAAINGDVLGQGLELALACDLRIAADIAHFGLPQITLGLIPWGGGTQLLPRILGRGKAIEMILMGETIDALQAHEIGLVNKVVPSQELMPAVTKIANELASRASTSLRYAKEAVHKGLDLTLEQGLHLEADLYALLQTTEDRTEGIKAFLERRKPQFKGK
jgi:Enoyl-CoA hydratase/carnithine racemase